jgi:glycosyltransferase involved in cell wall biosynthesis
MPVENRFLFNFSSSYTGGGLKRLQEYARWFDAHGGAWFTVHPLCANLSRLFPANRYFVVRRPLYRRVYDDVTYLRTICRAIGRPDLYYAYGIPVYRRFGRVNWFHLNNLLTVYPLQVPLSVLDRIKFAFLGWQTWRNRKNADVISAESSSSLEKMRGYDPGKLFLSVNGSDDELKYVSSSAERRNEVAVVAGTYCYKALDDAYRVFETLRAGNDELKLAIIGREWYVPRALRCREDVLVIGQLPREQVIEHLSRARYYISTTLIENSYNAASEGVFLAAESYVSDIGPQRELLQSSKHEIVFVPGVRRPLIHVRRADASSDGLKSWQQVITDMLSRVAKVGGSGRPMLAESRR